MNADERARLRPAAGARLLLALEASDAAGARYQAWVLTADGERGFTAQLGLDGAMALTGDGAEAAELDDLRMLARLTARGASKRVDDGLAPWPPRVLRWRGPGRGA